MDIYKEELNSSFIFNEKLNKPNININKDEKNVTPDIIKVQLNEENGINNSTANQIHIDVTSEIINNGCDLENEEIGNEVTTTSPKMQQTGENKSAKNIEINDKNDDFGTVEHRIAITDVNKNINNVKNRNAHQTKTEYQQKSIKNDLTTLINRHDHSKSYIARQLISCSFCGKFLMSPNEFFKHSQLHQTKKTTKTKVKTKNIYKKLLFVDFSKSFFEINSITQLNCYTGTSDGRYECDLCHKMFKNISGITDHFVTQKFRCPKCSNHFSSFDQLKQHLKGHFTTETKFECLICSTKFCDQNSLCNHNSLIHFECSICFKKTSSKASLDVHMCLHTGKKNYKCSLCSMPFSYNSSLKKHMLLHTGEKSCSCPICKKKYSTKEYVKIHLTRTHTKIFKYNCHLCSKSFHLKFRLNEHLDWHNGIRKHKCSLCDKSFFCKSTFYVHLKRHTEKKYKCPICFKGFLESYLINHMKLHIYHSGERKFKCDICSKAFYHQNALNAHKKLHASDEVFECFTCSKKFTRKQSLKNHMLIHTSEPQFKCSYCSKSYFFQASFNNHMITHVPEMKYKFKCRFCTKHYPSKSYLNKHLRKHTGEKNFKCSRCKKVHMNQYNLDNHYKICINRKIECSICFKNFTQSSNLKKHLITTHAGLKEFQCKICDKYFTQKVHLKRHLVIHTDQKPFECTECSKTFNVKENLKRHMDIHKNIKVKCSVCNKLFSSSSNLKKHMRLHSNERKFKCTLCTKAFVQKNHLDYHLVSHVGKMDFQCPKCPKTFFNKYKLKRHEESHDRYDAKVKVENCKNKFKCSFCPKAFRFLSKLVPHEKTHQLDLLK